MARIRTIKPEFFTSESILELEPIARLFFISLWCESDRDGKLAWKPRTLKYRYLPADDIDINCIAEQLIEQDLISVYEVEGKKYCRIINFNSHQVINNREKESIIPDASTTRESRVKAEGRERKEGKEGKGSTEEEESKSTKADHIPYSRVAELYNEVCTNLPKILNPEKLNEKRKRAIKKFWNHQEPENRNSPFFAEYFRLANQDQFFCGYNNNSDHSNWRADIEFLMRVETYDKFMERQECLN